MTKPKVYPGKEVSNRRFNNKRMHLIGAYTKNRKTMGIYSDAFDVFVKELKDRIRKNQQNVVIIDGDTGSGKSTLAIQLCTELSKKQHVSFDLDKDYIYSLNDLWAKLQDENASPINLIDEGSLLLNSKSAMTRENKGVVNLFDTMRSRGWTTIVCVPNIKQIDRGVRSTHADYRVHCTSEDSSILRGYGRGFFEVNKAMRYEYSKDGEPYWYLQYTGTFRPLDDKTNEKYQVIKLNRQKMLVRDMIAKNGGNTTDEVEA